MLDCLKVVVSLDNKDFDRSKVIGLNPTDPYYERERGKKIKRILCIHIMKKKIK